MDADWYFFVVLLQNKISIELRRLLLKKLYSLWIVLGALVFVWRKWWCLTIARSGIYHLNVGPPVWRTLFSMPNTSLKRHRFRLELCFEKLHTISELEQSAVPRWLSLSCRLSGGVLQTNHVVYLLLLYSFISLFFQFTHFGMESFNMFTGRASFE